MFSRLSLAFPLVLLVACEGTGDFNLFTIQDDKQLGRDVADEIAADPENYPLLDEGQFPEAYENVNRIRDEILVSDEFEHADDFVWEMHIIDDDETLNAFCTPGGYIYLYSGILRYLEQEDELAGVLGHEMAHADERHSTEQLTQIYGISTLLSVLVGGDPGLIGDIATSVVALQFSREDEAEADDHSVRYLCDTEYASDGAAGFFEQLLAEGQGGYVPEFLSSHPSEDHRVEDITALADTLECSVAPSGNDYSWVEDDLP
jgi:predicted Zn-dependent protease